MTESMKKPAFRLIEFTPEEREAFLKFHVMPKNEAEGYIWFAVNNSEAYISLWCEELEITADMAERAGLTDLAARLRAGQALVEKSDDVPGALF
jgi:hypothetical protein